MDTRSYILLFLLAFWNVTHTQTSTSEKASFSSNLDGYMELNSRNTSLDPYAAVYTIGTLIPNNIIWSLLRLDRNKGDMITKKNELLSPGESESNVELDQQTSMISQQNENEYVYRLIPDIKSLAEERDFSLKLLFTEIVTQNLNDCDLTIVIDRSFRQPEVLHHLVRFPNLKQVTIISPSNEDIVDQVLWVSSKCQGIILLMTHPEPFMKLGNQWKNSWNYKAKVIVVSPTRRYLEDFIQTKKAKKTEQILGIIEGDEDDTFKIFINELFWGKRGLSHISTWQNYQFTRVTSLFPDKISNLQEAELVVLGFPLEPFIIYRRDSEGQLLERYGREVEVYRALSEVLNFTIVEKEPDLNELFGIPFPNGSFSGMFGMLERGEGDLAVLDIWVRHERTPIMDFSRPYSIDQGCILARIDPPLSAWDSPALPFQGLTWIIIFVGLIIAGPTLYLVASGGTKADSREQSVMSFTEASLYTYGIHFSQPTAAVPKASSTQIFIGFLWIYSIILTTGYKSNLTAFLTIVREPKSIETLYEIYKSNLRIMGFDTFLDHFEKSEIHYLNQLQHRYHVTFVFDDAMKAEILEGKAVLIHSVKIIRFLLGIMATSSGRATYRLMEECMEHQNVAVAFQPKSPLKPRFDKVIARLFESGLPKKWFLESIDKYRKFQREDASTTEDQVADSEDGAVPLGLDHLQGVFIIWGFGAIISSVVFAIEAISKGR